MGSGTSHNAKVKIHIVSIGKGTQDWVNQGTNEYIKRMPKDFEIILHEISAIKRGENTNTEAIKQQESLRLLEKIPKDTYPIALTPNGKTFDTEALANLLDDFYQAHQDLAILIGGPEGLSQACLEKMRQRWSLSALTFPHALVRVIVTEQLYRAMTILKKLPYHR